MIEVYETGMFGKTMVYVMVDGLKAVEKLFKLRSEAAIYYDMRQKGKKIAYHWFLNPVTVKKMGWQDLIVPLPPE